MATKVFKRESEFYFEHAFNRNGAKETTRYKVSFRQWEETLILDDKSEIDSIPLDAKRVMPKHAIARIGKWGQFIGIALERNYAIANSLTPAPDDKLDWVNFFVAETFD